jgi:uncharacterized membrane-anchored protein
MVDAAADHPLRRRLADELHARPTLPVEAPARIFHMARHSEVDPAADLAYLVALCVRIGHEVPPAGTRQFRLSLDGAVVKWERYTEFCAWTVVVPGADFGAMPPAVCDAINEAPGLTLAAVDLELYRGIEPAVAAAEARFDWSNLVASNLGGGRATMWSDFRLGEDGKVKLILGVREDLVPRTIGNVVQRFLDIETYRMMALLALPLAQSVNQRTTVLDRRLAKLTAAFAPSAAGDERVADETLMGELGAIASEVEHLAAESTWRFGAAAAYHALVEDRIADMREESISGLETVGFFMARRLTPAMRTCRSAADRQESLSERVARSSQILRARIEIALEAQNQALLRSMEKRAGLQLRLQETVEGLSVVAISYYLIGLSGYLLKGLEDVVPGLPKPSTSLAVLLPIVVGVVYLLSRRLHRRLHKGHH